MVISQTINSPDNMNSCSALPSSGTNTEITQNMIQSMNKINLNKYIDKSNNEKFLKISPNLFTHERLHLFDSMDLYLDLMKINSIFTKSNTNYTSIMEQGDRLNNISTRILNKSLLKDKQLNKSKKKEGVKNMYHILNSSLMQAVNNGTSNNITQKQTLNTHDTSASNITTIANSKIVRQPVVVSVTSNTSNHGAIFHDTNTENKNSDNIQNKSRDYESQINLQRIHSRPRTRQEDPDVVVKGFDTTTVIVRKSPSTIDNNNIITPVSKQSSSNVDQHLHKQNSLFSNLNTYHNTTTNDNINKQINIKDDNRGNTSVGTSSALGFQAQNKNSKLFFSSADEDSDCDAFSDTEDDDDDEDDDDFDSLYEEEIEDKYMKKKWDNMIFSKKNTGDLSNNSSASTNKSSTDPIKKSLLSGLFLNNMNKETKDQFKGEINKEDSELIKTSSTSPGMGHRSKLTMEKIKSKEISGKFTDLLGSDLSKISNNSTNYINDINKSGSNSAIDTPTIKTFNVNALGAMSPPRDAISSFDPQAFRSSTRTRSSFSSIVSEFTSERYIHQSNAPPSAHTILPTALSTHMFLPNNIHQQRLAASSMNKSRSFFEQGSRRESIDIPSKSRNSVSIKTRVEIKEEEPFARDLNRRK
ncbi:hypothetical protein TPHA_0F01450 [Tetrapisispora phaffii CBS 4417]|uniref:Uncharacterized protein n=1 Tax=Tetrapisispora phaffii (strain ATCC 24235 / CBS 4417 / NBRC 1672 / NRRL Y-8282 / UCD 70-5) TaxID=1071381 RepID=G8BV47_TETPH|nr:hypothetical protein TPHA_0F01450 [Tetrapisispora phaffii CBS 4417]CCE63629.1 hypothetical protein TPHA_0F01450 [Tetrapisispora phaffii CBS 4417]